MEGNDLGKTSTGINPTVAGLLSYLLGFVSGVIFLIIEKENRFVRFMRCNPFLPLASCSW